MSASCASTFQSHIFLDYSLIQSILSIYSVTSTVLKASNTVVKKIKFQPSWSVGYNGGGTQ